MRKHDWKRGDAAVTNNVGRRFPPDRRRDAAGPGPATASGAEGPVRRVRRHGAGASCACREACRAFSARTSWRTSTPPPRSRRPWPPRSR